MSDSLIDFLQPARFRRPSARLTPAVVRITRLTWPTKDGAAGRQPTETVDPASYRCSVRAATAAERPEHLRDQDLRYYTALFYDDPRLAVRDKITWQGHTLVVEGVRDNSGGLNRTFAYDLAFRPPNRDA